MKRRKKKSHCAQYGHRWTFKIKIAGVEQPVRCSNCGIVKK